MPAVVTSVAAAGDENGLQVCFSLVWVVGLDPILLDSAKGTSPAAFGLLPPPTLVSP